MERIKKYKNAILLMTPLIAFVFAAPVLIDMSERGKNTISLVPDKASFPLMQSFSMTITVNAVSPINAVEGTIQFPKKTVAVESISTEDSIVTLWIKEPTFTNETGRIEFAGVVLDSAFEGRGDVATIVFQPLRSGIADITIINALMLAHDGKGTNILEEKRGARYFVQADTPPSSDINNDGFVTIRDVSIFIFDWRKEYSQKYDFNQDGEITLIDLSILISKVFSNP